MIKLMDILSEGKWKARGKYLTAPTGEDMSIPKRNDRDRIVIKAKGETFQFYDNGFEEYNIMGSRNSYHPKGKKDLVTAKVRKKKDEGEVCRL